MAKKNLPFKRRSLPARQINHNPTPGTRKLRIELISRVRSEMDSFYRHAHLSELLLLNEALLMADSERSLANVNDDCSLGNAIAECFGVNALGPVTPLERRAT